MFANAIAKDDLIPRTAWFDNTATANDWALIKNIIKVTKECPITNLFDCWADGDTVSNTRPANNDSCGSFVDASGRSWAQYSSNVSIFFIDTNGLKKPNQFGKDRWIFSLKTSNNTNVITGLPAKVGIYYDADVKATGDIWCNYPPCYYKSWLFN